MSETSLLIRHFNLVRVLYLISDYYQHGTFQIGERASRLRDRLHDGWIPALPSGNHTS